ncbi:MAG: hypothetical protein LW854_23320, partial [Rubrivivax sp.]|nr:hypothetical protein [Rubrivivax sp.]
RSRTSGENFGDFFMAQSSQDLEPPQNPGRFSPRRQRRGHPVPVDDSLPTVVIDSAFTNLNS